MKKYWNFEEFILDFFNVSSYTKKQIAKKNWDFFIL